MSGWNEPLDEETAVEIAEDPVGALYHLWGVPFAAAHAAIRAGCEKESSDPTEGRS